MKTDTLQDANFSAAFWKRVFTSLDRLPNAKMQVMFQTGQAEFFGFLPALDDLEEDYYNPEALLAYRDLKTIVIFDTPIPSRVFGTYDLSLIREVLDGMKEELIPVLVEDKAIIVSVDNEVIDDSFIERIQTLHRSRKEHDSWLNRLLEQN